MKRLLEIVVSIVLHPIAWILMLLNLLGRTDSSDGKKVIWGLVGILWGIGPISDVLVGDGALW